MGSAFKAKGLRPAIAAGCYFDVVLGLADKTDVSYGHGQNCSKWRTRKCLTVRTVADRHAVRVDHGCERNRTAVALTGDLHGDESAEMNSAASLPQCNRVLE